MAVMTSSSSLLVAVVTAWGNLSGTARMSLIGGFTDVKTRVFFYLAVHARKQFFDINACACQPADRVEGDELEDVVKDQTGTFQADDCKTRREDEISLPLSIDLGWPLASTGTSKTGR